jgi:hypothetical protein
MNANSVASPEGSVLTPKGWVIGKVDIAGGLISSVTGRQLTDG